MRLIKFRTWYKNEMWHVRTINFDEEIVWLVEETDSDRLAFPVQMSVLILMQSTGLKDKNGVEIYEGDIVNITQYFGGHPYGEIEHVIKRSEYNNDLIADSESGDWRTPEVRMTFRSSDDYEVIGNIYEHPELLEEEK